MKEITDWVAIGLSGMAIVFSLFTWFKSIKICQGQIELEISRLVFDASKSIIDFKACKEDTKESNEKILRCLMELNLDVYEELCSKYIDKKVDRKRVKRLYHVQLKNIVGNPKYKEIAKFGQLDCKYECIEEVYKDWVKLEDKKR
jgi:hypothetical protein